jgi:hypothetical protein
MRRRSDNQERAVLVKDVMKREVAAVDPDASVSLAAACSASSAARCETCAKIPTAVSPVAYHMPGTSQRSSFV